MSLVRWPIHLRHLGPLLASIHRFFNETLAQVALFERTLSSAGIPVTNVSHTRFSFDIRSTRFTAQMFRAFEWQLRTGALPLLPSLFSGSPMLTLGPAATISTDPQTRSEHDEPLEYPEYPAELARFFGIKFNEMRTNESAAIALRTLLRLPLRVLQDVVKACSLRRPVHPGHPTMVDLLLVVPNNVSLVLSASGMPGIVHEESHDETNTTVYLLVRVLHASYFAHPARQFSLRVENEPVLVPLCYDYRSGTLASWEPPRETDEDRTTADLLEMDTSRPPSALDTLLLNLATVVDPAPERRDRLTWCIDHLLRQPRRAFE